MSRGEALQETRREVRAAVKQGKAAMLEGKSPLVALGGLAVAALELLGLLVEEVAYVANRIDSLDDTIQRMDRE